MIQMNLQNRKRLTDIENRLVVINVTVRGVGKINYEFRINIHTLLKSRKGKIYPTECRAPETGKEREEELLK